MWNTALGSSHVNLTFDRNGLKLSPSTGMETRHAYTWTDFIMENISCPRRLSSFWWKEKESCDDKEVFSECSLCDPLVLTRILFHVPKEEGRKHSKAQARTCVHTHTHWSLSGEPLKFPRRKTLSANPELCPWSHDKKGGMYVSQNTEMCWWQRGR